MVQYPRRMISHSLNFDILLRPVEGASEDINQERSKDNDDVKILERSDVMMVYDRPVYTGKSLSGLDVLFFTGFWWAIVGSRDGFTTKNMTKDQLIAVLSTQEFHAHVHVKTMSKQLTS
jgi:hypothetical protein